MLETVKALCALSGVSSCEDEVRDYIITRARPHAETLRVDVMGNVIVHKKGAARGSTRLMLCAHMDEVGLMVRQITDDGFLKFGAVGGMDRRVLLGKTVYLGPNKVPGVIGVKPIHLTTAEERKVIPKLTDLFIDIGAKDKESAEALVPLGTTAAFSGEVLEFGEGFLKAKALDDRVGCAILLHLLERDLPMDCTFVFTAQEEVGTRGALAAAFAETPDIALIIEGTTAADNPSLKDHRKVCVPGAGPVIAVMDGGTIYDRALFERLRGLAEEHNIPWQVKRTIAGGTDAAAIQRTKEGVRVCAISAAVRYIHAPTSVVCTRDLAQMETLARLFIESIAKEEEK